jgi:cytochrome P450
MSAQLQEWAAAKQPPKAGDQSNIDDIRANPLTLLGRQAELYGDIFAYETGSERVVVLNHPLYARHVLVDHSERYSKIGTPELKMLRTVLGNGLMTVEGQEWVIQRAAATKSFTEERLRNYVPLICREVDCALNQLQAVGPRPEGVDIADELSGLTLRIVARCLFEAKLSEEEVQDVDAGVGALNEFMAGGPKAFGTVHESHQSAMEKMAGIVWSIAVGGPTRFGGEDSLLSILLKEKGVSESPNLRAVVDQILTFLMAGHETTAKALTWTLHLLSQHPEVQGTLHREVEGLAGLGDSASLAELTYFQVGKLAGVESALYESMRLYPPVWMVSRKAVCDDVIAGYRVREGSLVVISPYLLHRHSAFWAEPERFDTTRFLERAGSVMRECRYLPFGAGPRTCIGRRFAMIEMIIVLAMLSYRFRIVPTTSSSIVPQALVTLRPGSAVRVRLLPRSRGD